MNLSPVTSSRTRTWTRSVLAFHKSMTCRSLLLRSCRMRIIELLLSMSAGEADRDGGRDSVVQEPLPRRGQRAAEGLPQERVAETEALAVGCEQPQVAELFELLDECQR